MVFDKDYDTQCKQVWYDAWVNVAQGNSCLDKRTATAWADDCLKQFKERFAAPAAN